LIKGIVKKPQNIADCIQEHLEQFYS
jgi:hypothetical protein